MTNIKKIELKELCLNDLPDKLSDVTIQDFTEDINISGYIVCKHDKRHFCPMGISFGNEVFCKSHIIMSLRKNPASINVLEG